MMEFADSQQRCQGVDKHGQRCTFKTDKFCPGCAKGDDCGPASGFFCCIRGRNCMALHHRKRARTHAPDED